MQQNTTMVKQSTATIHEAKTGSRARKKITSPVQERRQLARDQVRRKNVGRLWRQSEKFVKTQH